MKKLIIYGIFLLVLVNFVFATISSVTRSVASTVSPNTDVTITISVTTTSKDAVIIREVIPSGWNYVADSGGTLEGNEVKFFITRGSAGTSTETYKLRSPASGSYTLHGYYKTDDNQIHNFVDSPIQVGSGGSCTESLCGTWGICSGGSRSRTCPSGSTCSLTDTTGCGTTGGTSNMMIYIIIAIVAVAGFIFMKKK